ncbi:exosortase-associated EpsI family protein [Bythopirellula goksoeyrii]|uniref:Methanolan biosynthesis EpsI domain-containing protein n=1 Tax=Bythopirellula goksoeyrii TaxID=1400387 RepID=A0A5B9QAV6_9BACT|nr:exosortase-associated EpsI family protein [Bythopirellula goksoeyrii]QEG36048.1 hypothetical protein Pr1d_33570 [Bythopirellula goksoeyrii]
MTKIPNESPGFSGQAQRWLALAVALGVTLIGGVLYGNYSQRWGPPPDLLAAAQQLEKMPKQFGNWQLAEEMPMEESSVAMLECAGYVNRRYVHQETGHVVNLAVIVGPPGPTAVHTPEICFSSRAYDQQGTRRSVELEERAGQRDEFWSLDFTTKNVLAEGLRIYYAWGLGDRWEASESPRYEFAASPQLYKLQLATALPPQLDPGDSDAGREFLTELSKSDWKFAPN